MEEQARLRKLREHLVELCRAQGPIPFSLYMEICLYHPELGYYTSGPPPMGRDGDYLTYPLVHPVFGRLLGKQVAQVWELMGRPTPFTMVEMGGGRGLMCQDMLRGISQEASGVLACMEVILVDRSPALLEMQLEAASFIAPVKAMSPETFFARPPLVGCVISNELLDAMPVHLLEMRGGRLQEVLVEVGLEEIREVLADPTDPRIQEELDALGSRLLEGQRVELGLAALEWMEKVARGLERGVVISLDFGYSGPDVFHPLRTAGTLMAYKAHLASPDPYLLPGGQDICAHVNFQALIEAGKRKGLHLTGLVPQDRFLLSLGLLKEMEALEARRNGMGPASFWAEKLALRKLLMPQPAQGGFQVMVQHKGWEPCGLRGLAPSF